MKSPNFCINHPNRIAFYIAANRYFCEECRGEAIKACAKQPRRSTISDADFDLNFRRKIARRDAAIRSYL